jgi:hypothetical protein
MRQASCPLGRCAGVGPGRAGEPAAIMGNLLPAHRQHHPGMVLSASSPGSTKRLYGLDCMSGNQCALELQVVDSTDRGRVGIARKELTTLLGRRPVALMLAAHSDPCRIQCV